MIRSLVVWLVNMAASLADEVVTRWPNETHTPDPD